MRFFSFLVLVLSATAAAQATESATLVTAPLRESVQSEVSVSGNVIVGVMTLAAAGAITEDQIEVQWAAVPVENQSAADPEKEHVCLRVASRDGIYTSRNAYELPKGASRPIHLPYDSKHGKEVKPNVTDDKIALAATPGDCDSGSSSFFLVSRQEPTEPSEVVIYLNSFGATDVFYEIKDENKKEDEDKKEGADPKACEYVTEGRRTTYDYICRLESVTAGNSVPVTIIRERFGREQPSITITIIGATKIDAPQ